MKKIAFITTVNHNVGDDFVREGLKYLLRRRFKNETLKFENIHKHSPITCRYGFEWFRKYPFSQKIDNLLPLFLTKDRIMEADLVIQSGAPVYWCHDSVNSHCADNEWYGPLIRRRLMRNKNAKLLNLAAGTCQKYQSDGSEFMKCSKDAEYIRKFFANSSVTTLRDTLAKKVLNSLGLDAQVLPCSSIFAIDEHGLQSRGDDFIVVNYMEGGSHYTFGQTIDKKKWKNEFSACYWEIKKSEKVVFACHNKKEVADARDIDSHAEIFYSTDFLEYINFYSRARLGIMNRVHGAFMMASFGKPSIVIGNDTRARMASEIGLKSYFVNDVNSQQLIKEYERLTSEADSFKNSILNIKQKALDGYMTALKDIL